MAYNESKYIVGEVTGSYDIPYVLAIVFPDIIAHSAMRHLFVEGSIRSAGFCTLTAEYTGGRVGGRITVRAYGESISLGVKSNPELDEKLLARALCLS